MKYHKFLEIGDSQDLDTFRNRLISFAAEMGFSRVGAFVISELPDGTKAFAMIHNAPDEFCEITTKNDADTQRDPVHNRLKRSAIPFMYDQGVYVDSGAGDLWEQQAPYGYKSGIAVSLKLPNKQFMLGFDGPDRLPSKDEAVTQMLANLQLVAVHAQDAALRLLPPPTLKIASPQRPLTPRETATLRWTAAGKTAKQVSEILGVSDYTVTYYMRNIFEKLGVSNKHQAVGVAHALGLI